MSLDDRIREDLHEIADDVTPSVEAALRSVLAARDRRARSRTVLPRVLGAAASLVLVGGLVAWWLAGRDGGDDDVVIEPHAPTGTYEVDLRGDLAGSWRLRFLDGRMSLVAPDTAVFGTRATSAPYDAEGEALTTELLAEVCDGPGSYTWDDDVPPLRLTVADDDCALRVRLLTGQPWSPVAGSLLAPSTYETPPLSIERMRRAALAEGFRAADVDEYLTSVFPGVDTVTYTLKTEDGAWSLFDTEDGGVPTSAWSGVYEIADAATVVAEGQLCFPITYDYRLSGDRVDFVVVDDPCTKPKDVGELIAQTTIYESAPFQRVE